MKLLRPTDAALWLSCWRFVQWQGSCGMTCDIIACDMNRFLLDRESSNSIASKLIRIHLQKCTYLQRTSHCNKQSIYAVHLFPPLMDSEQKFASANSICAVHIVHQLCETKTFLKPGQGLCWRRFDTDEWRGGCWKLLLFDVCRPLLISFIYNLDILVVPAGAIFFAIYATGISLEPYQQISETEFENYFWLSLRNQLIFFELID